MSSDSSLNASNQSHLGNKGEAGFTASELQTLKIMHDFLNSQKQFFECFQDKICSNSVKVLFIRILRDFTLEFN